MKNNLLDKGVQFKELRNKYITSNTFTENI